MRHFCWFYWAGLPKGWPKLANNIILETPADGGVAIGVFAEAKATFPAGRSVPAGTTVQVSTDYPFEDEVVVVVTVPPPPPSDRTPEGRSDGRRGVPLRVRVPAWATKATVAVASSATDENDVAGADADRASAWPNEAARPVEAGAMHYVMCLAGATTKVALTLNPEVTVEVGWGDAAVQREGNRIIHPRRAELFTLAGPNSPS